MGTDYKAKLYLVVPVTLDDFIEVREETRIGNCRHPEAKGVRFCPMCGLPVSKKTQIVRSEFVRPHILACISSGNDFDLEEDESLDGPHQPGWFASQATRYDVHLRGAFLLNLHEDESNPMWVLYVNVLSTMSSRSGGGYDSLRFDALADKVETFKKGLVQLGLGEREVSVVCDLFVD